MQAGSPEGPEGGHITPGVPARTRPVPAPGGDPRAKTIHARVLEHGQELPCSLEDRALRSAFHEDVKQEFGTPAAPGDQPSSWRSETLGGFNVWADLCVSSHACFQRAPKFW